MAARLRRPGNMAGVNDQPTESNFSGKKFKVAMRLLSFFRFTPEVVAIDTSGKFFDRICSSRKSLVQIESGTGETDTVKRRTRSRKPRGKRRNTISGTDQKELREAIAG